jgi:hypothetical protein
MSKDLTGALVLADGGARPRGRTIGRGTPYFGSKPLALSKEQHR